MTLFPFGTRAVFLMESALKPHQLQRMLQPMPQIATPSLPSQSFARLMADLAAPTPDVPERALAWNDDELEDDVATLSYERALQARGRYLKDAAADPTDRSLLQPAELGPIHDDDPLVGIPPARPEATSRSSQYSSADLQPKNSVHLPAAIENNLKSASITIRLSEVESVQLRQRAAEAGLTISAYLRSCTFEAESLRAQVKEALAKLRADQSRSDPARSDPARSDRSRPQPSKAKQVASTSAQGTWFGWFLGFLPRWHSRQSAARA
jgi:predicted DNA binding CopG/RHH family protein